MIDEQDKKSGTNPTDRSAEPDLWLDSDGIIHEHHHEEFVTKNLAMFAASERKRLAKNKKRPLLVTFDKLVGFAPDTRDMTLEIILANMSALAYFADPNTADGKQTRAVYDSFFSITPWPLPVKIFNSKSEALAWLKTFA